MATDASTTVTAVEGGHIHSLEASANLIRQVIEERNARRQAETGIIGPAEEIAEPAQNPKDVIGSTKLPMHLWPACATAYGCIALLNGALKYGRSNWRAVPVRASIYSSAIQRHIAAWFEGLDDDEDGVPHLASALASIAIIIDAMEAGTLIDDRQFPGGHASAVRRMTERVERLHSLHIGKNPRHYTTKEGGSA